MKLKQTHMPGEKVQTHTKYRELLSLSVSSSKSLEKKKSPQGLNSEKFYY